MYKVKRTIYLKDRSVDVWFGFVSKSRGKYTVYLLTDDPNRPLNHAEPILNNVNSVDMGIRRGISYAKKLLQDIIDNQQQP